MEISQTSHGKDMLCLGGFTYTMKKKANGWIRWQCTVLRSKNCKGGLSTDEMPINNPRFFQPHNHVADDTKVEVQKFRANLKESSRVNVGAKTQHLLATGVQTLSPNAMAETGKFDSIRRDIQRQKAKKSSAGASQHTSYQYRFSVEYNRCTPSKLPYS